MPRPLIANMILFITISDFLKRKMIYVMTTTVVQHVGMLEMIVLHSSMQEEDIIEPTNSKCHVFTF